MTACYKNSGRAGRAYGRAKGEFKKGLVEGEKEDATE